MKRLFICKPITASRIRGLLIFSIMMLSLSGVKAQETVSVSNSGQLEDALKSTTPAIINVE